MHQSRHAVITIFAVTMYGSIFEGGRLQAQPTPVQTKTTHQSTPVHTSQHQSTSIDINRHQSTSIGGEPRICHHMPSYAIICNIAFVSAASKRPSHACAWIAHAHARILAASLLIFIYSPVCLISLSVCSRNAPVFEVPGLRELGLAWDRYGGPFV